MRSYGEGDKDAKSLSDRERKIMRPARKVGVRRDEGPTAVTRKSGGQDGDNTSGIKLQAAEEEL